MPDLIEAFAADLSARALSQDVIHRYRSTLSRFQAFLSKEARGEPVALEAVEKRRLEAFLRSEGPDASRSSWNNRLAALRAFYEFLFREELVSVNPAKRVERLRVNGREREPLTFDEVFALVDALAVESGPTYRTRNVALVQTCFHCALRVSEVVSLDLGQVDFEHRLFRNVRRKGDKLLSALFNDVVAEALARYLADRPALLRCSEDEPALFLSDRGRRLSKRAVQDLLHRYGQIAGITTIVTPHRLRHSNVTELVDMGTPLSVVKEICGHSAIATTERYVHVNTTRRRRAINDLGARWEHRRAQGAGADPAETDPGEKQRGI